MTNERYRNDGQAPDAEICRDRQACGGKPESTQRGGGNIKTFSNNSLRTADVWSKTAPSYGRQPGPRPFRHLQSSCRNCQAITETILIQGSYDLPLPAHLTQIGSGLGIREQQSKSSVPEPPDGDLAAGRACGKLGLLEGSSRRWCDASSGIWHEPWELSGSTALDDWRQRRLCGGASDGARIVAPSGIRDVAKCRALTR